MRTELIKFAKFIDLKYANSIVDNYLQQYQSVNKRTLQQNKAIRLFCEWIAIIFNNEGMTYNMPHIIPEMGTIEMPYSGVLVMETIWRPIQISLYGIESTKDIDRTMVSEIADIIISHFGKAGIQLNFPDIKTLIDKKELENGKINY